MYEKRKCVGRLFFSSYKNIKYKRVEIIALFENAPDDIKDYVVHLLAQDGQVAELPE